MRDPCYDLLFESLKIGPLTAKKRFCLVCHRNGGGDSDPLVAD